MKLPRTTVVQLLLHFGISTMLYVPVVARVDNLMVLYTSTAVQLGQTTAVLGNGHFFVVGIF